MDTIDKFLKIYNKQLGLVREGKFINGYTFHLKETFEPIDNNKDMYYLTLPDNVKEEIIFIYHTQDSILIMVDIDVLGLSQERYSIYSNIYTHLNPRAIEETYAIPKSELQIFIV